MIYLYRDSYESDINSFKKFCTYLERWMKEIDPYYHDGEYSRDIYISFFEDVKESQPHCRVFRVGFIPFKINDYPCFNYNSIIEQFVLINRLDVAFSYYQQYESFFFKNLLEEQK